MSKFVLDGADLSWPSSAELAQVAEIRNACQKELGELPTSARDVTGDLRICRFLRFYFGNVKKATDGYRAFLQFRLKERLDDLRQHVIDLPLAEFAEWVDKVRSPFTPPLGMTFGETPDGHMLVYVQPGFFKAVDFARKRPESHTMDTDLLIAWLCVERMLKQLDDRSYELQRMLYSVKIIDFQNFGKEKNPIMVSEVRKWAQTNVPGIMQHYCEHDILILVVNAPFAFRMIFAFVQALISKRQAARVKVFANTTAPDVQGIFQTLGAPSELVDFTQGKVPTQPRTLLYPYAWEDETRVQEFLARKSPSVSRDKPPVP
mmetsp:Transcript_73572/g.137483  ORF Transcript_73572/g.137483 Transcript_73572/m.137483 type:complete len:318 (-) Transcript_73572:37-990(-)